MVTQCHRLAITQSPGSACVTTGGQQTGRVSHIVIAAWRGPIPDFTVCERHS
jgi:hypothetical protein